MFDNDPHFTENDALNEIILAGASDGLTFAYQFLPKMYTLEPGHIHEEMWRISISQEYQYVAMMVFRDAGKTTTARAICIHRICYAISETILLVSLSATHSSQSLKTIQREIESNQQLKEVFKLRIGTPCNENELMVHNDLAGTSTIILAKGITGQTRGTNVDHKRPDFILCDDVMDEETTATPEQRKKLSNLFFNDVQNSLAARSVNPHAKLMLIGTGMHELDLFDLCKKNPMYKVFIHSIFMPNGQSSWAAKWSTKELLELKSAAISMGATTEAGWMREKECRIMRNTFRTFDKQELSLVPVFEALPKPGVLYFMSVDPAPPPTENQIKKGMLKKDAEVWSVFCVNIASNTVDFVEQVSLTGQVPEESIKVFENLQDKYNVYAIGVEVIAYQITLAYAIRKSMTDRRKFIRVIEITDQRNKIVRITQTLGLYAGAKKVRASITCAKLREQFNLHPDCEHDDELDSASIGIMTLEQIGMYSGVLNLEPTNAGLTDAQIMAKLYDEERGLPPLLQGYAP